VTTFEGFILALHDMMDNIGYSAEGALTLLVVRAHKQIMERSHGQHHSDR
jgi:hypothetical protein